MEMNLDKSWYEENLSDDDEPMLLVGGLFADQKKIIRISRKLCYILRHNPDSIGINLDKAGWTDISLLLAKLKLSFEQLEYIVKTDEKQRYSIKDGKIRANQGHSLSYVQAVDLSPVVPPLRLYHGTTIKSFMSGIQNTGLKKMSRHHVHLSETIMGAWEVANRRKDPGMVIVINSDEMNKQNIKFYRSDNGIWLTDFVSKKYFLEYYYGGS